MKRIALVLTSLLVTIALQFSLLSNAGAAETAVAVFAGGCFWSTEYAFEKVPGVKKVISGFSGGKKASPSYQEVSLGTTGHAEAVQVTYDPKVTSFEKLLDVYWRNINPTQKDGQFFDKGPQYRTVIFYSTEAEKKLAQDSKDRWDKSKKFGAPIVTTIEPSAPFYAAEEEHQEYAKNNPERYEAYRKGSGREAYFKKLWN